jgi:Uma2 family endonuclease
VLAIEVADSSLEFDREEKGSLYARAGIEDYWIVNLVDAVVEVYRDPAPAPAAPHGWRHRAVREFGRGSSLAPLALPAVRFDVSALLSAPA